MLLTFRYGSLPECLVSLFHCCQVGGGIRDESAIETYLERGVEFVILGTRAVSEPHFVADVGVEFPRRIIVGLDARDGKVATDGWSKLSNHAVADLAQQFEADGVIAIIHTDISRDGMMEGVNVEASRALARELTIPVIASGGVTRLDDIEARTGNVSLLECSDQCRLIDQPTARGVDEQHVPLHRIEFSRAEQ